jgi:molecular chaperone GrpE
VNTQEESLEEVVTDGVTTEAVQSDAEVSLESLLAERDGLVDQLQRSVAEFQNYRRRVDQERFRLKEIATQDVIKAILPLVDDLQRAIASMPAELEGTGFGDGVTAIERKFLGVLERSNVSQVGAIGDVFDPALHEAVATDESGEQTHVVEVYQTGYKQGDSVVRPAMVKVGAATQFDA